MSDLQNLTFETADGVARITLNRPKFNMMNIDMMAEINSKLMAASDRRTMFDFPMTRWMEGLGYRN